VTFLVVHHIIHFFKFALIDKCFKSFFSFTFGTSHLKSDILIMSLHEVDLTVSLVCIIASSTGVNPKRMTKNKKRREDSFISKQMIGELIGGGYMAFFDG